MSIPKEGAGSDSVGAIISTLRRPSRLVGRGLLVGVAGAGLVAEEDASAAIRQMHGESLTEQKEQSNAGWVAAEEDEATLLAELDIVLEPYEDEAEWQWDDGELARATGDWGIG